MTEAAEKELNERPGLPVQRVVGPTMDDDFCPDCFRNKAHSVNEVLWGYCEKWWATRDKEAQVECAKIAGRIARHYRHPAGTSQICAVRCPSEVRPCRCFP